MRLFRHIGRGTLAVAAIRPEASCKMRSLFVAVTALALFAASAAQANVSITIDKDTQMMTVAVDGAERYHWPVSSGDPSHETPNGSFRAFRMEEDHYSKEFDDAPMPHSIFFTKIGHAIHGTDAVGRLGTPASHGCVRLSRAHAATLYALVQEQGVLNTTVTLTGSSVVALARNPRGRQGATVASREADPYAMRYDDPNYVGPNDAAPNYGGQSAAPGAPRPILPQVRANDGYIYPADGSSNDRRYPAPRGYARSTDGQVYYQQQPTYDNAYGYQNAPQPYQQQRYYQRGFYGYQN
jgi:L,D-transpeptidase-like protein